MSARRRFSISQRGRPGATARRGDASLGREAPQDKHAETIRLAELGELRDDEIAGLAEKANESKLRVDTSRERTSGGGRESPHATFPDREAVELYEAVIEAIKTS